MPAPASYGYWAVSDLYEEIHTGTATAFRQGNYGLLLKGDPPIPESFDVAKPSFNAFRLLHMMGEERLRVTGGTAADGVGAAATRSADGSAVQMLVYNHVDGGQADASKSSRVSLTLNNLPFTGRDSRPPVHRRPRPRQRVPGLAGDGLAVEPDPGAVGDAARRRRALLLRDDRAAGGGRVDDDVPAERLRRRSVRALGRAVELNHSRRGLAYNRGLHVGKQRWKRDAAKRHRHLTFVAALSTKQG